MICGTARYRVIQDPQTKNITLQVYRNYGVDTDEWVMVDHFHELTPKEFRCLIDFLNSLIKKDI
jgi:hypothetical protein